MNNPKIRFNGYTDAWEQRKLEEIFEERNEQFPMSEEYPLMAFIANVGVAPKGERYDRSALINDEQGKKYKRTELGDFIYSSNNLETGSIGLNNYGNACISPVYSIFKSKQHSDSDFLGRVLLRKEFINAMVQFRQGVVYGQWKIHERDFLNLSIELPSLEEQRMIGVYFKKIDALITLHQRKCEETKTLKKYMLQKMFPKDGESVPEIRFSGFTDAWEQRKVSEIAASYSGGTPQAGNSEYYNGDIPFIRSGEINEEHTELFITQKGMDNSSAKMVSKGDILYALYGATSGEVSRAKLAGAINQAILAIIPNENCDADFLVEWFRREKENITEKYLQGGQGNLSAQIIKNLEIEMPSLVEQKKIGTYFSRINCLITLHQRKCEQLQSIKKYMLQNMFV